VGAFSVPSFSSLTLVVLTIIKGKINNNLNYEFGIPSAWEEKDAFVIYSIANIDTSRGM
jgi:hypothetical protein